MWLTRQRLAVAGPFASEVALLRADVVELGLVDRRSFPLATMHTGVTTVVMRRTHDAAWEAVVEVIDSRVPRLLAALHACGWPMPETTIAWAPIDPVAHEEIALLGRTGRAWIVATPEQVVVESPLFTRSVRRTDAVAVEVDVDRLPHPIVAIDADGHRRRLANAICPDRVRSALAQTGWGRSE